MDFPWLCIGDFNEIVKAEEKTSGASRLVRQMVAFREALDFCGFRDLGYVGSPFTWCNNQFNVAVTWIRLDRGVATPSWTEMFPSIRVHHIEGSLSDHTPLWVCLDNEQVRFYKTRRPLKFEAVWMKDERCGEVIKNTWESSVGGAPMENLIHKVDACQIQLQSWSRHSFGNIRRLLGKKRKLLAQAESLSMSGNNHEQVQILRAEVYDLMVKENCL